jgi:hypothetical protein
MKKDWHTPNSHFETLVRRMPIFTKSSGNSKKKIHAKPPQSTITFGLQLIVRALYWTIDQSTVKKMARFIEKFIHLNPKLHLRC